MARDEATAESDLDLLADFEPRRDLMDVAGLKLDLEALLKCKVDVVEEAALSPYLRERVLREAQPLGRRRASICSIAQLPAGFSLPRRNGGHPCPREA